MRDSIEPKAESGSLRLEDIFDLAEIQKVQDSFANTMGVASIITDVLGNPITRPSNFCHLCEHIIRKSPKGLANCMCSDAIIGRGHPDKPIMQRCLSGGLLDGGTSIYVGDKHVANWLVGQVRDETVDDETMMRYAVEIGVDEEAYKSALQQVTRMPTSQFAKICETLHLVGSLLSKQAYQNLQQARLIAERRQAEEEREELVKELASKNRELENVLYASSHDLRSPLLNIQGFGKRLQQECEQLAALLGESDPSMDARQKALSITQEQIPKALRFIRSGIDRMETLIGGLLKISRLGHMVPRLEPLDMNLLIKEALSVLNFQIQEIGASIKIGPLPLCAGDPTLITQVFSNLLDNSIKYRDQARPLQIEVTGRTEGEASIYCLSDNGRGIAPENQEKIWELFQRLDPKGPVTGEGLGLNLAQRIVEKHRGKIWVESSLGNGCSFFVSLPSRLTSPNKAPYLT